MENELTYAMREALIRTSMDLNEMDRKQAEEHWGGIDKEFEAELAYMFRLYRESEEE